jgi:hypothetical protein
MDSPLVRAGRVAFRRRGLLLRTGFRYVDTFFKWYNFTGMVAVK